MPSAIKVALFGKKTAKALLHWKIIHRQKPSQKNFWKNAVFRAQAKSQGFRPTGIFLE